MAEVQNGSAGETSTEVSEGFEVWDYRSVDKNVLVTPEIRARLYHMKPGQVDGRHSHDLGHEVFLILEGKAEFNINGVKKVLGPGEMCVALADEIHQVRNLLPDKRTVMYLSVTPHVQPTHTPVDETDTPLPYNFRANAGYNDPDDESVPMSDVIDRHIAAAAAVTEAARSNATVQQVMGEKMRHALADGDREAVEAARSAMWEQVYRLHKQLYALDDIWNTLAARAAARATAAQSK